MCVEANIYFTQTKPKYLMPFVSSCRSIPTKWYHSNIDQVPTHVEDNNLKCRSLVTHSFDLKWLITAHLSD
ncbi:hypothetical protein EXN66_Car008514 [Channa argus]|uniref:Uncharacterized protein n=1 Tax=Channa argus TaxID=215402 RepID=A0A6G1PS79_CHAAH|nr:hypothetical protein EXN66_Car008514 [Channa argus]